MTVEKESSMNGEPVCRCGHTEDEHDEDGCLIEDADGYPCWCVSGWDPA